MMTAHNSFYVCYYLQVPIFKVQLVKLFLFQITESFLPTNTIKTVLAYRQAFLSGSYLIHYVLNVSLFFLLHS